MAFGTHKYNSWYTPRMELHLNQKGITLLASNFINVFKCIYLENKDEVINTNATISERNSGINTEGRSDNLLDKNESRAFSMAFSGNKSEISVKGLKIKNINRIIFGQISIPCRINLTNSVNFVKITLIYF